MKIKIKGPCQTIDRRTVKKVLISILFLVSLVNFASDSNVSVEVKQPSLNNGVEIISGRESALKKTQTI